MRFLAAVVGLAALLRRVHGPTGGATEHCTGSARITGNIRGRTRTLASRRFDLTGGERTASRSPSGAASCGGSARVRTGAVACTARDWRSA
jgi:hypothetical protein